MTPARRDFLKLAVFAPLAPKDVLRAPMRPWGWPVHPAALQGLDLRPYREVAQRLSDAMALSAWPKQLAFMRSPFDVRVWVKDR